MPKRFVRPIGFRIVARVKVRCKQRENTALAWLRDLAWKDDTTFTGTFVQLSEPILVSSSHNPLLLFIKIACLIDLTGRVRERNLSSAGSLPEGL